MTRQPVPLAFADTSACAKSLKRSLDARHAAGQAPPSHLEMLNLLARAAGWRNYQALKARGDNPLLKIEHDVDIPSASEPNIDLTATARKALTQFDAAARLVRLPHKFSVQRMAMWALWTDFEDNRQYSEKEVNAVLNARHTFGDYATLRRELVNMQLLARLSDCSRYWKLSQEVPSEVQGFLQALAIAVATAAREAKSQRLSPAMASASPKAQAAGSLSPARQAKPA